MGAAVDEPANRYARELIDAIHAAVEQDPAVQACRDKAKAAGIDLTLSLEAVIGIGDRNHPVARSGAAVIPLSRRLMPAPRTHEMTAADRRFLRSLRIAAAEAPEEV
jgi:hypothetical protein